MSVSFRMGMSTRTSVIVRMSTSVIVAMGTSSAAMFPGSAHGFGAVRLGAGSSQYAGALATTLLFVEHVKLTTAHE